MKADGRTFLKHYSPYPFDVPTTALSFDIHPHETLVTCTLGVLRRRGASGQPLVLDGTDLELLRIAVDGRELGHNEYTVEGDSLTVHDVPDACSVETQVRIHPSETGVPMGLYVSGGMYVTQCEPDGARRIAYLPDRPDVLSRFTVSVSADAERYPNLLSNGNRTRYEGPNDEDRHVAVFDDPFPKPTYLFALVAGDLAVLEDRFVTRSGRTVALKLYSEPHNIDQCRMALDVLKRAMRWDEERFGREFDLDVYSIVCVERYLYGAMENKGLNIFNTTAVLGNKDTATDVRMQRIWTTIAHEYFHNWTGNRVTIREFFQLATKEGATVFRHQEFFADITSRILARIDDVHTLRNTQFIESSGPLSRPARPASIANVENCYTASAYEYAAEGFRLMGAILGAKQFARGWELYFGRHDGRAVTLEDFIVAMEEASGEDLSQLVQWFTQAGIPTVSVSERHVGKKILELTFSQDCEPTPGQREKPPFLVPLAFGLVKGGRDVLGAAGRENGFEVTCESTAVVDNPNQDGTMVLRLHEREAKVTLRGVPEGVDLSLLRHFSAPVKVTRQSAPAGLCRLALSDTDGFARWDAAQSFLGNAILARATGAADGAENLAGLVGELLQEALAAPADSETKALVAASLTLPTEAWLLEVGGAGRIGNSGDLDILKIAEAWDAVADRIVDVAVEGWQAVADANRTPIYRTDFADIASRRLRQVALRYVVRHLDRTDPDRARETLANVLRDADNLSDRAMAFEGLLGLRSLGADAKADYAADFYERWARRDPQVLDLWFSVQARCPLAGGLGRVIALREHDAFEVANPNRVRALLAPYMDNVKCFHAPADEFASYRWVGAQILEIDGLNPPLAARLARPVVHWRRYDAPRASALRAEVDRWRREGVSGALGEVVESALEWAP